MIGKGSLTLADGFLRALPRAEADAMSQLLGDVAREMGFRHFALIEHEDVVPFKPWRVGMRRPVPSRFRAVFCVAFASIS